MNDIKLFEVGGSIRDELMGIQSKDRDFCAVSPNGWDALVSWSKQNMKKVFLITPEFFTIRGIIGRDPVDIVMCRKDGLSSDGRRPDFVEAGTILDDLSRRDFTMNSIARQVSLSSLSPLNKNDLIDPFNGSEDISNSLIKCVGSPRLRLEEDGLRILRALRFIITKDVSPDPNLSKLISEPIWWEWMNKSVSQERIREELHKMFKHDTAKSILFISNNIPEESAEVLFSKVWLKPTLEKRK